MILANPTKNQIRAQAKADVRVKLYWEERVAKEFRREFRRMGDDYEAVYAHTGKPISMATYEHAMVSVLHDSYRKISGAFKENIRSNVSPTINARLKGPAVAAAVDHALTTAFAARAKKQAKIILDTTQERMNAELMRVYAEDGGYEMGQAAVAAAMGKWFRDSAQGRAVGIATTETNYTAEFSKATEARAVKKALTAKSLLGILTGVKARVVFAPVSAESLRKTWVSQLDDRTRPAHAEADFQDVDFDEPFNVGGEQMMEPGDDSMGASDENLINCRCTAVFHVLHTGDEMEGEEPE